MIKNHATVANRPIEPRIEVVEYDGKPVAVPVDGYTQSHNREYHRGLRDAFRVVSEFPHRLATQYDPIVKEFTRNVAIEEAAIRIESEEPMELKQ